MAKGKMKDRTLHTVQDILGHLTEIWNDLIFEDVQSAFSVSQIRLNCVIKNCTRTILNRVKRMEIYSADIPKSSYRQDVLDSLDLEES
jgi:hypothetical protein